MSTVQEENVKEQKSKKEREWKQNPKTIIMWQMHPYVHKAQTDLTSYIFISDMVRFEWFLIRIFQPKAKPGETELLSLHTYLVSLAGCIKSMLLDNRLCLKTAGHHLYLNPVPHLHLYGNVTYLAFLLLLLLGIHLSKKWNMYRELLLSNTHWEGLCWEKQCRYHVGTNHSDPAY